MSRQDTHYHLSCNDPRYATDYVLVRFTSFRAALYEANTIIRYLRRYGTKVYGRAGRYRDADGWPIIWIDRCDLLHGHTPSAP